MADPSPEIGKGASTPPDAREGKTPEGADRKESAERSPQQYSFQARESLDKLRNLRERILRREGVRNDEEFLRAVAECDEKMRILHNLLQESDSKEVETYRARVDDFIKRCSERLEQSPEQRLRGRLRTFLKNREASTNLTTTPYLNYSLIPVTWQGTGKEEICMTQFFTENREQLGYLPFLKKLLVKERDGTLAEGDAKKQFAVIKNASSAVDARLYELNATLQLLGTVPPGTDAEQTETMLAKEALRNDSRELAEIFAGIHGDTSKSVQNAGRAALLAERLMQDMDLPHAIDYVFSLDEKTTYWTKASTRQTQKDFFAGCRGILEKKLAETRRAPPTDIALHHTYDLACIKLAEWYRSQGTLDPGSNPTYVEARNLPKCRAEFADNDFAARMTMNTLHFENLVLQFTERKLKKENPLRHRIQEKRAKVDPILADIAQMRDPAVQQVLQSPPYQQMQKMIRKEARTNEELIQQYSAISQLESLIEAKPLTEEMLVAEVNGLLLPYMDEARNAFQAFLDTGALGRTADEIDAAIGYPPLSHEGRKAYELLKDIQGLGYLRLSDDSWGNVQVASRMAVIAAVGIGVGVATGGLGLFASAAIGGLASTGTALIMEGRAYESPEEAVKELTTDVALNTATAGLGRVLRAARYAAFLRGGKPATQVFAMALEERGLRELATRETLRGLNRFVVSSAEGVANAAAGAGLDTALRGTDFIASLQYNLLFFAPMHLGTEYSANIRSLLGRILQSGESLPPAEAQSFARMSLAITEESIAFRRSCAQAKVDPQNLLTAEHPESLLASVPNAERQALLAGRKGLLARDAELQAKIAEVTGKETAPPEPQARKVTFEESSKMAPNDLPPRVIDDWGKEQIFGKQGYRVTDAIADHQYRDEGGWKLHLTVDPSNYEAVDRWLYTKHRGQYKLLSGGDHADGKDFTIYIGSRTDADTMSKQMTAEIGHLLQPSTADWSDLLLTDKIAARFDIQTSPKGKVLGLDQNWGYRGLPVDRKGEKEMKKHGISNEEFHATGDRLRRRMEPLLEESYGEFYTGKVGQAPDTQGKEIDQLLRSGKTTVKLMRVGVKGVRSVDIDSLVGKTLHDAEHFSRMYEISKKPNGEYSIKWFDDSQAPRSTGFLDRFRLMSRTLVEE